MIGRLQWHNAYPLAPWVLTSEPWRHLHHSVNYGSAVGSKARQEVGDHDIRIERADLLAGLARKYGTIALGAAVLEMSTERMHWYGLDLRRF
jgi:hypothetical protein